MEGISTPPHQMGLSNKVKKVWSGLVCPALPCSARPCPSLLRIRPGARKTVPWTEPEEGAFQVFLEERSLLTFFTVLN